MSALTRRHLLGMATGMAVSALSTASWSSLWPTSGSGFARIGGIEQWITIRGHNRAHTAMLFLHGGPGEAQSPFLSAFAPWEKRYIVAQWDQRGAGKTFGRNGISTPNMTMDELARDVVEVTQYVLSQVRVPKLLLVGHSWGSVLGLTAMRLQPELFHAFVGTGQIVSGRKMVEDWRQSAVSHAQAAKDAKVVAELSGLKASDFAEMSNLFTIFNWQAPFTGSDLGYIINTEEAALGPRSRPLNQDAVDWYNGKFLLSLPKLWPSVIDFDASWAGYDLPVPFFVIQGRDDRRTSPEAARLFVDKVRAPAKGYTAIDGGHFACFTNPTEFLNTLHNNILRI